MAVCISQFEFCSGCETGCSAPGMCCAQGVSLCLKQIPSLVPQVFGEGVDSVKKSLEGIFDDTVPDGKVKAQLSSCLLSPMFAASKFRLKKIICYFAISKHWSCSTHSSFVVVCPETLHISVLNSNLLSSLLFCCCIPSIPRRYG